MTEKTQKWLKLIQYNTAKRLKYSNNQIFKIFKKLNLSQPPSSKFGSRVILPNSVYTFYKKNQSPSSYSRFTLIGLFLSNMTWVLMGFSIKQSISNAIGIMCFVFLNICRNKIKLGCVKRHKGRIIRHIAVWRNKEIFL